MMIFNIVGIQCKLMYFGEMLREDFILDYGLMVVQFVECLGVLWQLVNELLWECCVVSLEMVLWFGWLFGNFLEFWFNVQCVVDLWVVL